MRILTGVEFFDQEETHAAYQARRVSGRAPNELMELDAFDDMLGDVKGLDVLDLGCGAGRYGREMIERGCSSYTGVDGSRRMVDLATLSLSNTNGSVRHARIEGFELSPNTFDVVLSRMTFHWIADLALIIGRIRNALRTGGRLVFSVEHPVITCCAEARSDAPRTHWLVDNYFEPGPRTTRWFDATVQKYHRSVEDYFQMLRREGLAVVDLREGTPTAKRISDEAELQRRRRVPLMLLMRAEPLTPPSPRGARPARGGRGSRLR